MIRILLYRAGGDIIGRLIRYFTESEWGHVAIYAGGYTYEQTWPGVRKTPGMIVPDTVLITPPVNEAAMLDWLEASLSAKMRYNWLRLIAFCFIYPLRWFFSKANWVPFSAAIFGEVCSSFVDEAMKAGGVDLWPYRGEHATVPGDFAGYPALRPET